MTAVGFVGLGTMGSALTARLLAAGWDVAGCDIDPARVTAHRARSSAEAKARALPVLRAMTRGVHDVGKFGNGSAVKFIANLLVAIHNVAAAEALVLAERAGLDLATVLAAVADGAGTSAMFEVRGPAMAARDYSGPA